MRIVTYIIYLLIIFLLIYIFYGNYNIYKKIQSTKENNLTQNNEISVPNCTYDITTLPEVSDDTTRCCLLAGLKTGDRIFNFDSHDYIISKTKTSFYEACLSACMQGVINGKCVNGEGQTDYDSCLLNTQPAGCKDTAKPVARTGTDLWYVKSYSSEACSINKICSDV